MMASLNYWAILSLVACCNSQLFLFIWKIASLLAAMCLLRLAAFWMPLFIRCLNRSHTYRYSVYQCALTWIDSATDISRGVLASSWLLAARSANGGQAGPQKSQAEF